MAIVKALEPGERGGAMEGQGRGGQFGGKGSGKLPGASKGDTRDKVAAARAVFTGTNTLLRS